MVTLNKLYKVSKSELIIHEAQLSFSLHLEEVGLAANFDSACTLGTFAFHVL